METTKWLFPVSDAITSKILWMVDCIYDPIYVFSQNEFWFMSSQNTRTDFYSVGTNAAYESMVTFQWPLRPMSSLRF